MSKILGSLIILALLSGCWCGIEEQDPSSVGDYFSGCWTKFKNEKPDDSGGKSQNSGKNSGN